MGVERTCKTEQTSIGRARADEFSRMAAKVAVAQICESVGFERFKGSVLESLADIAIKYILHLGKTATSCANLTGRTRCNVFDIVLALEGSDCGDERSLSSNNRVVSSGRLWEIIDFVGSTEEIPFSQPLPRFPIVVSGRNKKMIPSFVQMSETAPAKHIPVWLPAFPDSHTYKQTPMWMERASDPHGYKIEQARQRRKAERALLCLQQKLVCNGFTGNSTWGDLNSVKGESMEDERKSHFVPRLEIAQKDDAVNVNDLSVVEAFGPAIEAGNSGFCDEGDGERKEKRPVVQFKMRTGKKLLEEPLGLSLRKKGEGRPMPFVRDEDRDDKRRRVEFILRQCIINPMDLN